MTTTVTLTINDTAKKVLIGLGVLGFTATTAVGGYFGINALTNKGPEALTAPVEVVKETEETNYFGAMSFAESYADTTEIGYLEVGKNGVRQFVTMYKIDEYKYALEWADGSVTTVILQGAGTHGDAWVYESAGVGQKAYAQNDMARFWYGDNGQIVVEGGVTIFFPQWVR